jgi:NAD dependent epimerase/dehydratase family enzyme
VRKQLLKLGHEPISLVRRPARNASEVSYDPANFEFDAGIMNTIDAVVNLAGQQQENCRGLKATKKS